MYVVGENEGAEREIDLGLADDTSLGDVAGAVFGDDAKDAAVLFVDGRPLELSIPATEAGLATGSMLALQPPRMLRHPPAVRLDVLAGPGAGMSVELPAGSFPIGSDPTCAAVVVRAPGVRRHHATLTVDTDGGVELADPSDERRRPVHPDATVRVGGALITCTPLRPDRRAGSPIPGRRGTVSFNRPPRDMRSSPERPVELPEKPRPPTARGPMSIVMLITPVIFGIAMAILIHPRMALFALFAPMTMIGHKIDGKRKKRKFARDSAIENAANAEALAAELELRRAREVVRRRGTRPSVASLVARAANGSANLWERRPQHEDFMQLVAGYGYERWLPAFDRNPLSVADELIDTIRGGSALPLAPVAVDLRPGQVLGMAGDRKQSLELARGVICQAAVLHGPSDLQIAVVTDQPDDWDWVKWLPHTIVDSASGRRLLAATAAEVVHVVSALTPLQPVSAPSSSGGGLLGGGSRSAAAPAAGSPTLLVVDVADLATPQLAGVRNLLGGRGAAISGLAIAPSVLALPSVCTRTVAVSGRTAELCGGADGDILLVAAGATEAVARRCARSLARYDDPDRAEDGAELPGRVDLVDLLGFHDRNPGVIIERWRRAGRKPSPKAPLGVTEAGPLELDLISDGPHALLAGTTGAGKSELLRSLVAGMAASVDPEHLTFVLIDYKGGSAFDACTGLPHTVGMVTDLDDQLAERALTCLEAELRYREHRLRTAGADDLSAYLDLGLDEPLPRMLIVIDEFAAMAKELPEFMDALVDIAARGRSLGVHLLLATQRPAGVIRDNVRANTNMRIALRVQDTSDSMDVLGDRRAAAIGRSQPGRGFVRLGPAEVVPFQTALVTGHAFGSCGATSVPPIRPFAFQMDRPPWTNAATDVDGGPTDLELLVEVIAEAAEIAGMRSPRRPWPDPLPESVRSSDIRSEPRPSAPGDEVVVLGLQDEPDHQQQSVYSWSPASGSLMLYGNTGSGTTTALATLALGLAAASNPEDVHMYVLDFDTGGLAPLTALPHVGGVVVPGERERQIRLIRTINEIVTRRKGAAASGGMDGSQPRIVLIIDGFDGFKTEYDIGTDAPVRDALVRIVTEGPAVGVVTVISGLRANSLLPAMPATIPNKLVFRMPDPLAAGALGLRGIPRDLVPGRCYEVASAREIQIARPDHDDLAVAILDLELDPWVPDGAPKPIESLPSEVKVSVLAESVHVSGDEWFLPVGVGDTRLETVGLALGEGDHVLIAGEPRCGKSTLLASIAALVSQTPEQVTITAVAPRRSPLRDLPEIDLLVTVPETIDTVLSGLPDAEGPQLVLVDDADLIDTSTVLAELATSRRTDLHVVASARRDVKRQYNHWVNLLAKSRKGLWLQPSPGLDGDLWSTPMPRHIPTGMPPGRGFLVCDGVVELVQAARP